MICSIIDDLYIVYLDVIAAASQGDQTAGGLPSEGLIGIGVGVALLLIIIIVVCVAMYYRRRYRNLKAAVQEPTVEFSAAAAFDGANSK